MTYGEYRRALPRLRIKKGYHGNETAGLQVSAPIGSGVTILSGQVIYLANGSWSLATSTLATGLTPYLALQDSVDTDVLSSGLLLGLSCAGQYLFGTGYYVRTDGNFAANDLPLVISNTTPGSLTIATTANGFLPGGGTAWDAAVDIVGVTSLGGEEQVGPSSLSSAAYAPATGSGSTSSVITTPASGGGAYIPAINTEGLPMGGPTYMLNFTAKWSPHRSVAA